MKFHMIYSTDYFNTFISILVYSKSLSFNPCPDTVFRHLRSDRGGGATPLGVSKRSGVGLSEKDQQIALAEYSRLVVLSLVLD